MDTILQWCYSLWYCTALVASLGLAVMLYLRTDSLILDRTGPVVDPAGLLGPVAAFEVDPTVCVLDPEAVSLVDPTAVRLTGPVAACVLGPLAESAVAACCCVLEVPAVSPAVWVVATTITPEAIVVGRWSSPELIMYCFN